MKKLILIPAVYFFVLFSVFSKVSFENPQINKDGKILFSVKHELSGTASYKTLFCTEAAKPSAVKILTCFPEKMELLSGGSVLQVRNRYGIARYSFGDSKLTWISTFSEFPSDSKCLEQESVSSDGRWIAYLKKTGFVKSQLILKDAVTSAEVVLDENAEFSYEKIPAEWSPDGKFLVYEKNGVLYFCEPTSAFSETHISEEFRKIGLGTISSVAWANSKTLVYINGGVIYKISTNELYTRGLYSSIVGAGAVIGRLPLGFDDKKDRFWINESLSRIVTVKADSIISSYRINGIVNSNAESLYSKPFSNEIGSSVEYKVFWTSKDEQILWVRLVGNNGEKKAGIFRFSGELKLLALVENPGNPEISPDGKKIAFTSDGKLYVYEIDSWNECAAIGDERIVSYLWNGNNAIIAGGTTTVRNFPLFVSRRITDGGKILFLSSVKSAYWKNEDSDTVCALSAQEASSFYIYDQFKNSWQAALPGNYDFVTSTQNGKYRVFVGRTGNPKFENALFIRSLLGKSSNAPMFKETVVTDGKVKRVALIFDAVDNAEGVSSVLSVLADYGVKATFFLNGEFIRRYPKETNQIAKSGHDCGSMYFAVTDLTEKKFVYDEDFIRRGLARNEDEFYSATGCELSLLWHAPFYKSNAMIRKAGDSSGYRYVEAGRLSFDTFTLEKAASGKYWYLESKDIISVLAENASDGMIIPVNLGISEGTRSDYLYEKLSLLIGALLDEGCQFVLVQSLK